jgi:outer membrane lipoprotein-sorting protein
MRKIALLTMVIILAALLAGCAKGEEVDKTPPVISAVSASSITETGAVITWTTDEDSTSQVEYGTTSAYGSTTTLNENLVTSHSATLSELTSGTTYHYRVKSKDASGNEKNSGDYTFTTATPPDTTAPVISGVAASNITTTSATITWTTDELATSQVEYGLTTSYGSTTPLNSTLVTSHSISLPALTSGTTYHYRVKSKDASNNQAVSGDYTFTTASAGDTTPPLISGVSASGITTSTATITWTTDELAISKVEYGLTTGYGSTAFPMSPAPVTNHSISLSGLTAGTTYHYRVISRDASANEAASGDHTFTTTSAGEPIIAFGPASFSFSATEGGANPSNQTLNIWNSGSGILNWSVSDNADWLTLNPTNGTSTGEHDPVTLSVDISGMSTGTHNATITISAPGATNTPQTASVTLTINAAGAPELPGTYSYSIEYSDSDGNTMTTECWVKEGKVRIDWHITTPGEEEQYTIFIRDGDYDWYYLPNFKYALRYPPDCGVNPVEGFPCGFDEYYYGSWSEGAILASLQAACATSPICADVVITGHEDVDGEYCTIFTWTSTDGSTYRYWISTSNGWLVKWEFYNADTGVTYTMQFTDVDLNPEISDDIFDVDLVFALGTTIMDVPCP